MAREGIPDCTAQLLRRCCSYNDIRILSAVKNACAHKTAAQSVSSLVQGEGAGCTGNNLPVDCRADTRTAEQAASTQACSESSVASFPGLRAFGLLEKRKQAAIGKPSTLNTGLSRSSCLLAGSTCCSSLYALGSASCPGCDPAFAPSCHHPGCSRSGRNEMKLHRQ